MRAVAFLVLLLGAIVLPCILAAVTPKDENKLGAEEENNQVGDAKKYCGKCCGSWYHGQCSHCCSPEEEANLVNTDAKPQKLGAEEENNQVGGAKKYCGKCCGSWYHGQCSHCCSPEEEANLVNSDANPQKLVDAEMETSQVAGDAKYHCNKCCGWYHGQCTHCCSPDEEANLMNSEANTENFEQSNYGGGRKVSVGGSERKP